MCNCVCSFFYSHAILVIDWGKPKMTLIIASMGAHIGLDTEIVESYNSAVEAAAAFAPNVECNLLSARVDMKADLSDHCIAQSAFAAYSVRKELAAGSNVVAELDKYASDKKKFKSS